MKGAIPLEPKTYTLSDALAELDALVKPEGVDAKLWRELKGALREALLVEGRGFIPRRNSPESGRRGVKHPPFSPDSGNQNPEPGWPARRTLKLISSPPTGAANKVNDLTATRETNGVFTLSWHYRNLGDYDQNGVVGVSDITPLAMRYNETYDKEAESNSIQAVIDGSGSGKIGIEDVTQIAMNFGVSVAKYSVRGGDAYAGPFAESANVGVSPQVSDARKVLTINIGASPQGYWQVVPQDAENAPGEASNIAGITLQIRSVTPTSVKEGTVVTFSADVLGAGPFTYDWDFGGQAIPSTSTEASPKVVLTRDTGGFPARLTVTNYMGNAAYPFTLTKLAREWKYEVVWDGLQPLIVGNYVMYSLQYENGELWFYVGDAVSAGKRHLIHGLPGNWSSETIEFGNTFYLFLKVGSNGQPWFLYSTGAFGDETLKFTYSTADTWQEYEIAHAMALYNVSFCIGEGEAPFVTYSLLPPEAYPQPIHSWRLEGGEPIDVIMDTANSPNFGGLGAISSTGTDQFPPASVYLNGIDASHSETRCAIWNEAQQNWDISVVDSDGESGSLKTGIYPVLKYGKDGCLGLAYSQITPEITPGVQYDKLTYRHLNFGIWSMEEVRERLRPSDVTNSYEVKDISYDPLGFPVIAYAYYKGTSANSDRDIIVEWKSAGGWIESVVYEAGSASSSGVGLAFDDKGTPYVLYGDKTNEEVIIARYE